MTRPIQLSVRLGEPLWRSVGRRRVEVTLPAGSTVQDVLAFLADQWPTMSNQLWASHRGQPVYRVFVNGQHVPWPDVAHRTVEPGDTVYIFPPAAGGEDFPPLPRAVYERDTVQVAQELLGCYLVRVYQGELLVGRIVETEAYVGLDDKASHASVGKTQRNAVMFGPAGHAYVYVIYGMHHCLNVVTEAEGYPAAVLIRALEPVRGVEIMRRLRGGRPDGELTNGPGKLCQALAIDRRLNGHDLCTGETLWIAPGDPIPPARISSGPRVGVRGDERAVTIPWRFAITGNPYVSRPQPWRQSRQNG